MKKRRSLLRIVLPALAGLVLCHSAQAQRALQLNPNTKLLIEGFGSGANTIKITATGTLEFVSGFTLTGGSHLKAALSLNNVENTALSTWAGTSNLTTLGTVTTGTWQGSIIAPAYLGTGSSISTKFLRGDGTWQTVSGGGGLTIGTSAITGGTEGKLLIHGAGDLLAELATSAGGNGSGDANKVVTFDASGVLTALQLNVVDGDASSYLGATNMQFSDGTGNTVSIAMPAGNANLTWPTGTGTILSTSNVASGVATWLAAPTIANLNSAVSDADLAQLAANSFTATQTITKSSPTLSAPQLKIVGYGVNIVITDDDGSTVRAYTDIGRWFAKDYNDGNQTMSMGRDGAGGMGFGASSRLVWSPNAQWWDGSPDVSLGRDGAGILSQHNGATPQRWQVANTHASGTSLEAWVVDWQTTANACRVGTIKGSGGGTARKMIIQTDGTERIRIEANGEIFMTLPTSAGTTGSLWNDSGTVKVAP